jgi:hypothetical protein
MSRGQSGLNRAHVGEIERGESNVTLQTLKLIADTRCRETARNGFWKRRGLGNGAPILRLRSSIESSRSRHPCIHVSRGALGPGVDDAIGNADGAEVDRPWVV